MRRRNTSLCMNNAILPKINGWLIEHHHSWLSKFSSDLRISYIEIEVAAWGFPKSKHNAASHRTWAHTEAKSRQIVCHNILKLRIVGLINSRHTIRRCCCCCLLLYEYFYIVLLVNVSSRSHHRNTTFHYYNIIKGT